MATKPGSTTTNALAQQSSPYLLQHAHNPVKWQPWCTSAFEQARREDKPIFLSVGYSTCHWCHVMAHESFEHDEVAAVLNEHFVSIKVDREELPDVDAQYMLATQAFYALMQQPRAGGWPNSVWLMPDGRPFYAGTYFPRAMFVHLLGQLAQFWRDQRREVEENAQAIRQMMERMAAVDHESGEAVGPESIDRALAMMAQRFDSEHGGFVGRPKFPPHSTLGFLTALHQRQPDERLRYMITATLDGMSRGGVCDQIGGGFHRYSTDERWFVPHFEKMLYDNAQLLTAYARGWRITQQPAYRWIAGDSFDWLIREMTDPAGGFYSAIDADNEGREGKFYVWSSDEIRSLLGDADATLFMETYGIVAGGNWHDEATGEPEPTNIPHLPVGLEQVARSRGMSIQELHQQLDRSRARLLAARNGRVHPHLDDKVLASWNGLMIGALAEAGELLNESRFIDAAKRAAEFILTTMRRPDGQLHRVYRKGQVSQPGYLDDYAYLAGGLLSLHRATGEARWLDAADQIVAQMIERFGDELHGGFYFTSDAHDPMILRSKNPHAGGNQPHVNGAAAMVLVELGLLKDDRRSIDLAVKTVKLFAGQIADYPMGHEELLLAAIRLMDARHWPDDVNATPARSGKPPLHVEARITDRAADQARIVLTLTIDPPYHIYGPRSSDDSILPTSIALADAPGMQIASIDYPQAQSYAQSATGESIEIYKGRIDIQVSLRLTGRIDRDQSVVLRVRSQPCDDRSCLAPRTDEVHLKLGG